MSDPNQNPADLQPKPMKGKYDGRRNNGATKARRRANSNLGRKPAWLKHLSRNSAYHVLRKHNDQELWSQILTATTFVSGGRNKPAVEVPDMRLRFEALRYLTDRRDGRPFIAENPQKADPASSLREDQRLQDAITQLVPTKPDKPTVM